MRRSCRLVALCALLGSLGCRPSIELPDLGTHERTLTRLDGPPALRSAPTRLRVFAAGINPESPERPWDPESLLSAIEALGERAAAFGPDILVVYDVPFAGKELARMHRPTSPLPARPEVEPSKPAEELAVAADLYYRLEHVVARDGAILRNGRVARGVLIAAEDPLRAVESNAQRADAPSSPSVSRIDAAIPFDAGFAVRLSVADNLSATEATAVAADVFIQRRAQRCSAEVQSVDGVLCLTTSGDWRVVQWSGTSAAELPAGLSVLRVELESTRAAMLAPPDPTQ